MNFRIPNLDAICGKSAFWSFIGIDLQQVEDYSVARDELEELLVHEEKNHKFLELNSIIRKFED